MLLEHGPAIQSKLDDLLEKYEGKLAQFTKDKFYWACGYDVTHRKYEDWDCCDVREITGSILWDVLLGFPYSDDSLSTVKTKLAIGMLTFHQVRFVTREAARTLRVGGEYRITFRDFDRLHARWVRKELDPKMFVRYIYGSSLYYGSRRKSCWTPSLVEGVCTEFPFRVDGDVKHTGMNSTLVFKRIEGRVKRFSPEPIVKFNEDGTMHNEADDFHHDKVGR